MRDVGVKCCACRSNGWMGAGGMKVEGIANGWRECEWKEDRGGSIVGAEGYAGPELGGDGIW